MSLPAPGALVFDLDGTLIDSRADIRTAVNRTREGLGLPPLSLEVVVGMVGEGARTLVERALADWEVPHGMALPRGSASLDPTPGDSLTPGARPSALDSALATYHSHYRAVCLDETRAYPGIPELLEALAPRFPLALLTNKGEALSRKVLQGLGLGRHFREILGGDSLPTRKPDPSGLLLLGQRLGLLARDLLLVGDTWIDAATARNAGSVFVLVEWGFPRPAAPRLDPIEADLRIAHPRDLLAALGLA